MLDEDTIEREGDRAGPGQARLQPLGPGSSHWWEVYWVGQYRHDTSSSQWSTEEAQRRWCAMGIGEKQEVKNNNNRMRDKNK